MATRQEQQAGGERQVSGKRRARVAAPGARRVVFTGVMAVPDDFGRLRILLVEHTADGALDGSWAALARELPRGGANYSVPYELWETDADGVRGVARVAVPERHRAHWGRVAEGLRGREVRVEATVRPYAFRLDPAPPRAGGPAPPQTVSAGVALDLAMLGPRSESGAPDEWEPGRAP